MGRRPALSGRGGESRPPARRELRRLRAHALKPRGTADGARRGFRRAPPPRSVPSASECRSSRSSRRDTPLLLAVRTGFQTEIVTSVELGKSAAIEGAIMTKRTISAALGAVRLGAIVAVALGSYGVAEAQSDDDERVAVIEPSRSADCMPLETRPPNVPEQRPAFPEQTR